MGEAKVDSSASRSEPIASRYYCRPNVIDHLHQGELLRDVWEWIPQYDRKGKVVGAKGYIYKLAIVVTQDCDLAQDFRIRKDDATVETDLISILLCQAHPANDYREQREEFNRSFWGIVRSNKAERYQYLSDVPVEADAAGQGHEPILVDFKSYFTVRTVELYRQINATDERSAAPFTILDRPWREHFQQRFASFQARVGLPLDHFIPESRREPLAPTAT